MKLLTKAEILEVVERKAKKELFIPQHLETPTLKEMHSRMVSFYADQHDLLLLE